MDTHAHAFISTDISIDQNTNPYYWMWGGMFHSFQEFDLLNLIHLYS